MKRWKALMAVLVIMLVVLANGSVAQAAEPEIVVREEGISERLLTDAEVAALPTEAVQTLADDNMVQPLAEDSSYQAYEYTNSYSFYRDDEKIAQADICCVVFRYTDGKVHLYSRTIDIGRLITYSVSRTYGSIVNTDGSVCYTTGDRVRIWNEYYTWRYAIDFAATPTGQSFHCYEITY